jgi:hypothetical protein
MRLQRFATAFLLVAAVPVFCQTDANVPPSTPDAAQSDTPGPTMNPSSSRPEPAAPVSNVERDEMQVHPPTSDLEDQMLVPPSVSTGGVSLEFASETPRSNYVSGGLRVVSTYDDNIASGLSSRRISDDSYALMPTFAWRQSSSRVLWNLAYAPGFTFYHHNSGLNQSSHNLGFDSQFRLSPHVTLSLRDAFAKTSNPFNQLTPDLSTSTNLTQPAGTIISPVTNQITNSGSAQLTYQFGLNSMVGATGLFSDLHYLNPSQVPSLQNSHSKAAEGFYTYRISKKHYLGAKYQFQYLLATPIHAETETHGVNLLYTIYLRPTTSFSFYAGPQYADSRGGGLPSSKTWSPMYGGSFAWQGQRMSFAVSGDRGISAGGGLQGAIRGENASASVRGQLTRSWNAGVSAFYSNSGLLTPQLSPTNGGHSVAGTVSLGRQIANSFNLELAYMRLHQSYANLSTLSAVPNTNRVWLSLSYQFTRPIGR